MPGQELAEILSLQTLVDLFRDKPVVKRAVPKLQAGADQAARL